MQENAIPAPPAVLIVDDDESIAELVGCVAQKAGFAPYVVAAQHLAHAYEAHRPELVILDILMPECDGFEVLVWLRDSQCDSALIILSANEAYLKMAKKLARDYKLNLLATIAKPFDVIALYGLLQKHSGVDANSLRIH